MSRSVAIVGRPNVGKSRLFNRLARKRISIVHDQPGITRDVISTEIEDGQYTLLDTGGLGLVGGESTVELTAASEQQVDFAINAADLIVFVIDGLEGITGLDQRIGSMLRRSKKDVLLVVNKADFDDSKVDLAEAYRLGLGEPLCVSAEHGTGETNLREAILGRLGPAPLVTESRTKTADDPICVCFVGRPNVGKSSLSNRLLKSDRLIVSDVPGTTRDAISLPFQFRDRKDRLIDFRLIDTAGIKAQTKLSSPVEYFSRLRSLDAIKETDVVYLVLDAVDGVTQQDKAIAGEAVKERKPIIVVINKWDVVLKAFKAGVDPDCAPESGLHGYEGEREYREKYEKALLSRLFFTPGSPVIFVSAQSGYEVSRMLNAAVKINRLLDTKIPTGRLNARLSYLTERTPPPSVGGKRFKVYYATQTGNRPFRIRLFCNREEKLTEQYRRYLEAGIVEEFELGGCPVHFDLVGKEKHETGGAFSARKERESKNTVHIPKWKQREAREDDPSSHETIED
ncbi:MAG: ribosome biogenesis GTPase Der [Verrucomicrobiota bacterium]